MIVQTLAAGALVTGSACYAGWTLMPAGLRRRAAAAMLSWPLPEAWRARLQRRATAASGCGCDGCDHGTKAQAARPAAPAVQPIRFHPRPPR